MSHGPGRVLRAINDTITSAMRADPSNRRRIGYRLPDLCALVYGVEVSAVTKAQRVAVLRALHNGEDRLRMLGWTLDTKVRPARLHRLPGSPVPQPSLADDPDPAIRRAAVAAERAQRALMRAIQRNLNLPSRLSGRSSSPPGSKAATGAITAGTGGRWRPSEP
jgi:hypothetical protein